MTWLPEALVKMGTAHECEIHIKVGEALRHASWPLHYKN